MTGILLQSAISICSHICIIVALFFEHPYMIFHLLQSLLHVVGRSAAQPHVYQPVIHLLLSHSTQDLI